jgi:hypothetical protein
MIMSTVSMTQTATGRIAGFFLFPLAPGMGIPGIKVVGVGLSIAFIVAIVLHDLLTERRVHPATVWGAAPYLALEAVIFTPFYGSPTATALTYWVTGVPAT